MAGAAAGGFVARAFESMLKESSNKKHSALQSAIQTYLDSGKDINQQSNIGEAKQVSSAASNQSGSSESGPVETRAPSAADGIEPTSRPAGNSGSTTTFLASAGRTLGDNEAELVLNPLRLAFETKNLKLVELALDCLHKLIEYNHLEGVPGLDGGKNSKLLTDILNMICSSVDNSSPDSTTLQVLKVLLTAIASTKMRVHGEPLLGVIRVCCNIALNSKSPINRATSMATLTQMLSIIFRRIESDAEVLPEGGWSNASIEEVSPSRTSDNVLSVSVVYNKTPASVEGIQNLVGGTDIKGLEEALQKAMDQEDDRKVERDMDTRCMSVEQLDALLVFHAICKMGMKEGNDDATTKTRTLSMELLQGLLDGVSDSFRKNYKFIDSIRAHLSYAILRASASQSSNTFQYAMGTLSVLLLRFRESLKVEIGILFPVIVLRSLDGSDLNQKLSVLRMLEKVCKDPQMLVDLYINYDCDLEAPTNLFEKMVAALSKVAQGTQNADPKSSTAYQFGSIKTSSLQVLVNALKSLIVWEKAHKKSEKQNKGKESSKEDVSPIELDESKSRESMNFSGMKFETAIREFLQGIRFPGEAQKIDSIIEKFAERYCADNPSVFKNADTAYVLAYAVIMLNNDAHSPMVSSKMSKSDFICMNTGNDAEESTLQEVLEDIYDSIVKEEIKITIDPAGSLKNSQNPEVEEGGCIVNILNLALPKRKSSTDSKSEKDGIIKKIQGLIKDQGGKGGIFYTSHRIELIYPMVEDLAWPILATFAVSMGESDDKSRTTLCMEGFKEGINITHVLGMDTLRYAFLTSLLRYNSLHAPKDIRAKNVEALETVLALCHTEINALEDFWYAILECISRLEHMVSSPAMTETIMQGSPQVSRDPILQSLKELSGKPTEQIFINTVKLPSESVVEFFTALCSVSAEELKQTPPRIFSLYKVVEISYYNMDRIHMVWSRIWSILAQHFIFAGSHADESIAIYTMDSLRHLGTKYLEHPELANFTFQNDVLKPFAILMQSSKSESIRGHALGCIVKMVKSKVESFKSGWQSVFKIFTTAADDHLETIVESAFENVEQVILEHFNKVSEDCFMDCIYCLIGFANNKTSESISLKAIALLRICEDRLSEGLVPGGTHKGNDTTSDKACDLTEHYWFPMLAGLSKLTSDPRSEVRNCALEVLFDLLNVRGSRFSSSFWDRIFQQVLFPNFDHVRHSGNDGFISSGEEWFRESTVHALQLLCDLFNTFYKEVCFLLPPLLSLLLDCAKKTDQSVVSISLGALVHLIEVGGHQFSDHDWDTLLKSIRDASYSTQPLELLNDLGLENGKHEKVLSSDLDSPSQVNGALSNAHSTDNNHETVRQADNEGSEGMPSPSGRTTKPTDDGGLQRSQTFGQKIMGNMKDNLFVRTFTSKPKNITSDETVVSSPPKIPDGTAESDTRDEEEEGPMLVTIRCKCITQLLLLGAIDGIQKKYWNKLNAQHKITMMEILVSALEFAASYNSYTNLRLRMHKIPAERPPLNLLRQELTGTCIYLDILQKATTAITSHKQEAVNEEKLEGLAEEKLVSFCEQVLREASDFQSTMEETTNMDIHRVLELRSPIIVKVLKGMCEMNPHIFRNHLRDFYPPITKLVCCDQMEIRGALADLFSMQLSALLA